MKVSKLAKVLHALRKPDTEVSFDEFAKRFEKRHPGKSQERLSEMYYSKTHRAFSKDRPFHEDGFARERLVKGLKSVSGKFKREEIDGIDCPQPKDYFPRGTLWVRPEFAYRFVNQGLVKNGKLFAQNREEAEFKLKERGIRPTYLEPIEDINNSPLQFLGRAFNRRNWENSSSQINWARKGVLSGIAFGVIAAGCFLGDVIYNNTKSSGSKQGVADVQKQKPNSLGAQVSLENIPREIVSSPRVAVIPEIVSTNVSATNNVSTYQPKKQEIPREIVPSPKKAVMVVPEARNLYVKPQTHYVPATNVNVKLSVPTLPQTQQVYRVTAPMPAAKTNRLERVVSVPSVPKTQRTNVVHKVRAKLVNKNVKTKVQYDLTPTGKMSVERQSVLFYPNNFAYSNEFPFVLAREGEQDILHVPTLVSQNGRVKNELDLSPTGIKASSANTNFPVKGTRLITPNGFWCELDSKRLGTNQVYIFPRANGSFYAVDSNGASLKSDSNRNISLTSANGVYSTKPLARREYLERRLHKGH